MPVKLIRTTRLGVETFVVIEVGSDGKQTGTPVRTYMSELAARQYIARKYRDLDLGGLKAEDVGRVELLKIVSNGVEHEVRVELYEV